MAGTDGRALHLLDVEYLGLGPQVTHIFGIVADAAHELGVEVWAAAYTFNLARSLAQSVDVVVDLTVGHAFAA